MLKANHNGNTIACTLAQKNSMSLQFANPRLQNTCQLIRDSWKHCQEKRGLESDSYRIYGWCIMTGHGLVIAKNFQERLPGVKESC